MIPIEHYWPPELLAKALPDRFGHLVAKTQPSQWAAGTAQAAPGASRAYSVEHVSDRCSVIRPQFGRDAGTRVRDRKA